jgi:hypothetical protein
LQYLLYLKILYAMRFFVIFISLITSLLKTNPTEAQAQLPLIDNITYTGALTANGWLNYPSVGVNTNFPATSTTTPSLIYPNYPQSNIGNAVAIIGDGEDVYLPFATQTAGSVYAAAMINVSAASQATSGDYFYHFYGKNQAGTNYQFCRFFIKDEAGTGFKVSLLKTTAANGAAHSYASSATYPYGTTIIVVLKYEFITTSNPDDPCTAYIFTGALPSTEPTSPTVGPVTQGAGAAGDAGQLLGLSLRRSDANMNIVIDGFSVANTWATLALPVSLTRFEAVKNGNSAVLNWDVALEKDEPRYTVQQSNDGVRFEDIFTQNSDNENNTLTKKYQYEVKNLTRGTYYFRLKMTDKTGWSENSAVKMVRIESDKINIFAAQNELTIRYEKITDFENEMNIYIIDEQGRKVKTLVVGQPQQRFLLDDLKTGLYFLQCKEENQINGFKFFKP